MPIDIHSLGIGEEPAIGYPLSYPAAPCPALLRPASLSTCFTFTPAPSVSLPPSSVLKRERGRLNTCGGYPATQNQTAESSSSPKMDWLKGLVLASPARAPRSAHNGIN
ncbi:hypothetical protein E2C01_070367 [Portunus trituberculatus]|uniref:Uncharacterized protein n=1 Tax=Portunus trituberculatus TaxID=210409 RepID=A0A5B7I1X1_PORTR|nr:hypothetical protein [Portunus trituberculatus]